MVETVLSVKHGIYVYTSLNNITEHSDHIDPGAGSVKGNSFVYMPPSRMVQVILSANAVVSVQNQSSSFHGHTLQDCH